jgi:hypothetical protein
MSGAFGTETRKQALLQDLRNDGPIYQLWATENAFEGDLTPIASDFDLHPAFVRIMPVLGAYGRADARDFYLSAIESLPAGGDPAAALRHWFLFAWAEPTWGLSKKLAGSPMLESAQHIIDLVRTSLTAPVDKATWRAARQRLIAAQEAANAKIELIDAVLSMAWNLDQTPGAAGDVVNSWSVPIMWTAHSEYADKLSDRDDQVLHEHMTKAHEAAVAELGEISKDAAGRAAYEKATDAYWAAHPEGAVLRARMRAQMDSANAKVAAWRRVAQQAFIEALAAVPAAAAA